MELLASADYVPLEYSSKIRDHNGSVLCCDTLSVELPRSMQSDTQISHLQDALLLVDILS